MAPRSGAPLARCSGPLEKLSGSEAWALIGHEFRVGVSQTGAPLIWPLTLARIRSSGTPSGSHPKETRHEDSEDHTLPLVHHPSGRRRGLLRRRFFPDSCHAGHGHARRFPSGPPGAVQIVEFELFGQPFIAMNAGPLEPFNHAVLFVVNCGGWADSTLTATPCWPAVRRKPAAG